jgi:carbon-monoxide dehydrogenase large subunit
MTSTGYATRKSAESEETSETGETSGAEEGIGASVPRKEDPAALTGRAEFTDDVDVPEVAYVSFVRSQYAHATVEGIDASAAEARDDVVDVFTAADIRDADGEPLGRIPLRAPPFPDAPYPPEEIWQPAIVAEKVRHQGEILAVVVATDRYGAADAADLVDVSYDTLDPVVDPRESVAEGAPTIHEACPDNVAFEGATGDGEAVEAAFEAADHTVSLDKTNQRLAPLPLEPRAVVAEHDESSDKLTFRPTTQIPHAYRRLLADILPHPENRIDVVAPEMGGGFGARQHPYPEDILVGWVAKRVDRPVKWRATRVENQESENDGRGYDGSWELAVDDDGQIQAIRADILYDLGAWIARASPALSTYTFDLLTGQYDIPAAHCRITGVLTNTARVDAYRGVTETDPILMLERLVEMAAREVGLDPAELRRRNLVPEDAFPYYESATGATFDSGDYEKVLDMALENSDYEAVRERQERLREEGRYLGVGIACWIEKTGLGTTDEANEPTWGYGRIQVHPDGEVTVAVGGSNHGQGHETTMAQIAADELHVALDDIEVVQNDTTRVPEGVGTYASRTAPVEGGAVARAAEKVLDKCRRVAAYNLGVDAESVEFVDGEFRTAAGDSMSFEEASHTAYLGGDVPEDVEPGVEAHAYYDPEGRVWPFGTHVVVVEVDPESGEVEFEDYVIVEDCGQQINPLVVEGQIHGGTAQGIGQALYEDVQYDENGNLVTASLMDYTVPKATHVPEMDVDHTVTLSPHNPNGIKGMGESGSIAAPGAVVNAIDDALGPLEADPLELPATAERIWRAAQD